MSTNPTPPTQASLQDRLAINRMFQSGVNPDALLQREIDTRVNAFYGRSRSFTQQLHAQQEASIGALETQLSRVNDVNDQDVAELSQDLTKLKTKVTEASNRNKILSTELKKAREELREREEHRKILLAALHDKSLKKAIVEAGAQHNIETLRQIETAAVYHIAGIPNIKREMPTGVPPIKRGGSKNE